jgi:serine/threonine protein kinase
MTKVTANKLLELLRRSGLIDEARLTAFLEKATAEHGEAALEDQDKLAEVLIQANIITRWQADKLLAGKHKGFRLGKYKLLGQIGKGGMSSVYLAEHELMKRRVAIKVLPQNRVGDASYLERFRLEARAVARLDDPNIVRAYDIDNEGNIHYIVMEYVDGQDLHQIVSQNGPLTYEAAVDYIAQVANGLQHAHEMGMVHRDIKPANCLLDRNQVVKLLDLGLAKLTEDDQTSLTMANEENVLGTADYLAPEQALNSHEADSRSDIYSLGCTLYFLLTGRPPFPEGSISERLLKHQTSKPDSIFKIRGDAPPSLVDMCESMMAKKPDERPQTAGDVAERLTEWLAERGRKLGGGHLDSSEHGSGVGSGIFQRFGMGPGMQTPMSGIGSSGTGGMGTGGSRGSFTADRDTKKLNETDSSPATEEEIGLAPLDEEAAAEANAKAELEDELVTSSDVFSKRAPTGGSSKKSLVEEELHDPEFDAIKRKVAQRAQYNPLRPPNYVPPNQSSMAPALIIGGIVAMVVIGALLFLLL